MTLIFILILIIVVAIFIIIKQHIDIKFLKKVMNVSGTLSGKDAEVFWKHMEEPKVPNEALKKAKENYDKVVGIEKTKNETINEELSM